MNLDEAHLRGGGQRALLRLLRVVLRDEEKCREAIHDALAEARRAELPEDPHELLLLVRTYLAPRLLKVAPPNLVMALIDDLSAEMDERSSGGLASSRMRAKTPYPGSSGSTSAGKATEPPPVSAQRPIARAAGAEGATSSTRFPKLRESVAKLVRTASTRLNAVRQSVIETKNTPSGFASRKVSVVVVESDRLARASLARALVSAKFDVSVLDSASQIAETLRTRSEMVVLIVDTGEEGIVSALRGVARDHPHVPVIGWSTSPAAHVESLLTTAGIRRSAVVPRSAASGEAVEAVRRMRVELANAESVQARGEDGAPEAGASEAGAPGAGARLRP